MSLSSGDEAQILGVGVAWVLACGAGVFKTADLQGTVNARWRDRTDFALAALQEKTVVALEKLRDDVSAVLPRTDVLGSDAGVSQFDPGQAIADLEPLASQAARAAQLQRAHATMRQSFDRVLRICPLVVPSLVLALLGGGALAAYYGELTDVVGVRIGAFVVGGLGIAGLMAFITMWVVLMQRLSRAELLAGTTPHGGDDV